MNLLSIHALQFSESSKCYFNREQCYIHCPEILSALCTGLKELVGVERKTKEELAKGMDEAFLSCVNVGKDVCLPWMIIGICSARERNQRVNKNKIRNRAVIRFCVFLLQRSQRMRQLIA